MDHESVDSIASIGSAGSIASIGSAGTIRGRFTLPAVAVGVGLVAVKLSRG